MFASFFPNNYLTQFEYSYTGVHLLNQYQNIRWLDCAKGLIVQNSDVVSTLSVQGGGDSNVERTVI